MSWTRRDFLAAAGGIAAGYGLSRVPLRRLVGLERRRYESVPGVERWLRTACQLCPGACGMEVRLADGRPVGVRGNLLHPISRGGLCPVGAEALHVLYSPDRIRAPLQRVGGTRGDGQWKKVTWDEALAAIADRLDRLRKQGRSRDVFLVDGYARGLLSAVARRFVAEVGAPENYFVDRAPNAMHAALSSMQGVEAEPAYDLEKARTIVSFGVPLLEGWESPVQGQRAVGGIRSSGRKGSPRALVQFDVRASRTAHRADRFILVKPGSYGAVALAIAYVLIRQQLYDRDFVAQHCFGFDDWTDADGETHVGFKNFVLRECRPQDLEPMSGVAARDVVEVAKLLGEQGPSLAIADGSATAWSNGVVTAQAVHALNALLGAIDRPGGSLIADPVPFAPVLGSPAAGGSDDGALPAPAAPPYGHRDVEQFLQGVAAGDRKVGALFLLHANPFFSAPRGRRVSKLLDEDGLVVSFSPFPDESTRYADFLLPDHSFLERWQDAVGPRTFPFATCGVTRPVSDPLYDTKHSGDALVDLTRRLGGRDLPGSFQDLLKTAARGIFDSRRGSAFTGEREAEEIRQMARRGWWIPHHRSFDEFWTECVAKGGWWDPAHPHGLWGRLFRTRSRRLELFARRLHDDVHAPGADAAGRLRALRIEATGDAAFLPRPVPARCHGAEAGGLHLVLSRPLVPNTAVAASLPWVREVVCDRVAWETWAEMHPGDATRLGLEHGALIRLSAGPHSFVARLLVTTAVQPGTVHVPLGIGRAEGGRWARQRGTNPNAVIVPEKERIAGTLELQGTRVHVAAAVGATHA